MNTQHKREPSDLIQCKSQPTKDESEPKTETMPGPGPQECKSEPERGESETELELPRRPETECKCKPPELPGRHSKPKTEATPCQDPFTPHLCRSDRMSEPLARYGDQVGAQNESAMLSTPPATETARTRRKAHKSTQRAIGQTASCDVIPGEGSETHQRPAIKSGGDGLSGQAGDGHSQARASKTRKNRLRERD